MSKFDKYITGEGVDDTPVAPPVAPTTNRFQTFVTGEADQTPKPQGPKPTEMRSADETYTRQFGNKAQDVLTGLGMAPYNAGRITEGVGNLVKLNPATGWIPSAMDTGYYATASNMPLGQRLMHAGSEALGMLPGATLAKRMFGGAPQKAIAPVASEIDDATRAGYKALENSPTRFAPDMANDVRNEIALSLAKRNPEDKKRAMSALDDFVNRKSQIGWSPNDFENLRKSIKGGENPAQIAAGQDALETLDRYMANPPAQHIRVGSPQQIADDEAVRRYARGNAATGFRNDLIEDIAKNAEIKAEAGKDAGAFVRNKLDSMLTTKSGERKTAGFTEGEKGQIRDTLAKTMSEKAGEALMSPTAQFIAAPFTTGGAVKGYFAGVDPLTAGAAAGGAQGAMTGFGAWLKGRAGQRAQQDIVGLGENIRMRSPLAQSLPGTFGYVTDPRVMASDAAKYLAFPQASDALKDAIDRRNAMY